MGLLNSSVDREVFVCNDHLFLKVIDLLLLHLSHFFHHVIARDEDSFEVGWVRKILNVLNFALKIDFPVILRPILSIFSLSFGL